MNLTLYKTISFCLWPFLNLLARIRLRQGKERADRLQERFGRPTALRPEGKLIWIHAASNGEALSAIPLIQELRALPSYPTILITTMTVTSADLIKQRLGEDEAIIHQFIPYDHPIWVSRFQDYWHPDMAIWIESELWPNHLMALQKRAIPAALLNARLSDKSLKRWSFFKASFLRLIASFDVVLTQSDKDLKNLNALGVEAAAFKGNLKDIATALPFDIYAAEDLQNMIGARPVLLYASTHDPEEDIAARIHQKIKNDHSDLLTIIIPRHPKRGEAIALRLNDMDLSVARRSLKMSPRPSTDIYVADTLGEMGVFFQCCPIVFVGNSLGTKPGGGHNLLEPAWFNCAILSGDDLVNFSALAEELPKAEACVIVKDEMTLEAGMRDLLSNPDKQQGLAENAYAYVSDKQSKGLDDILAAIAPVIKKVTP